MDEHYAPSIKGSESFVKSQQGRLASPKQAGQDPLLVILREEGIPIRKRTPHIPTRIAEIIDRSLATKEDERYQHAGEMHEALARAWKDAK